MSFVREGVGDYGLDLNIEFGRRILITEDFDFPLKKYSVILVLTTL